MPDTNLVRWIVRLMTPDGEAELEVPTFYGPEVAGRRAQVAAVTMRWGDFDEIRVIEVYREDENDG